ncbi:serine/threonine-protein kinase PLK1-like [Amblyomma americanum]
MASTVPTSSATSNDAPEVLVDRRSKKEYILGKLLGKGGFGECYEVVDQKTSQHFAAKIVPKTLLVKSFYKTKITQEIQIQKALDHNHNIRFHSCFEDGSNVYIILELCSRQSLFEMHRRRKMLTEGEARYFIRQLLPACRYLREQRVVHWDLKLGNLLLNEGMKLKVADFGLATRIGFEGERRKTLCGTPNYIAPEVLSKKRHRFEVDVWSMGCILYTMLVVHPPFAALTVQETYVRIKKNEYLFPSTVGSLARALIWWLLQHEPGKRHSIDVIREDAFITGGPLPSHLPTPCLVIAPRFDDPSTKVTTGGRSPLLEINEERYILHQELEVKVTTVKKREELQKIAAIGGIP